MVGWRSRCPEPDRVAAGGPTGSRPPATKEPSRSDESRTTWKQARWTRGCRASRPKPLFGGAWRPPLAGACPAGPNTRAPMAARSLRTRQPRLNDSREEPTPSTSNSLVDPRMQTSHHQKQLGFETQGAYRRVWPAHMRRPPFLSATDRPGGINYPHLRGAGGLRKTDMFSDSRKAQRNSFAHHRAELLFKQPNPASDVPQRTRSPRERVDAQIASGLWSVAKGLRPAIHAASI